MHDMKVLSLAVPKILNQKAHYMNSPEFLNDIHNKQMLEWGEELYKHRLDIAKEIEEKNKTAKDKIVQAINGYARIKKYLDKNFRMNFSNTRTFFSEAENNYDILKTYKIHNASLKAMRDLDVSV